MSLGKAEVLPDSSSIVAVVQDQEDDIALKSAEPVSNRSADQTMAEMCEGA